MNITVETTHRVTAKLPDDERPLVRVRQGYLLVSQAEFKVTGGQLTGLVRVWGYWRNAPGRALYSTLIHPAAVPTELEPVVRAMIRKAATR